MATPTSESSNGTISIEPAGTYSVEAKNDKGDVELTLPPNASATVNGQTHNGDIVTDYGLTMSGDENKTVSGKIGSGTAHIQTEYKQRRPAHQEGIGVPGRTACATQGAECTGRTQRSASKEQQDAAPATGYTVGAKKHRQQAGARGSFLSRLFCFFRLKGLLTLLGQMAL